MDGNFPGGGAKITGGRQFPFQVSSKKTGSGSLTPQLPRPTRSEKFSGRTFERDTGPSTVLSLDRRDR